MHRDETAPRAGTHRRMGHASVEDRTSGAIRANDAPYGVSASYPQTPGGGRNYRRAEGRSYPAFTAAGGASPNDSAPAPTGHPSSAGVGHDISASPNHGLGGCRQRAERRFV